MKNPTRPGGGAWGGARWTLTRAAPGSYRHGRHDRLNATAPGGPAHEKAPPPGGGGAGRGDGATPRLSRAACRADRQGGAGVVNAPGRGGGRGRGGAEVRVSIPSRLPILPPQVSSPGGAGISENTSGGGAPRS